MSSKPSPESVAELRKQIAAYSEAEEQRQILTKRYNEIGQQLAEAAGQAATSRLAIAKLVEGMDCDSASNFGWEGRFTWMMRELYEQTCQAERDKGGLG